MAAAAAGAVAPTGGLAAAPVPDHLPNHRADQQRKHTAYNPGCHGRLLSLRFRVQFSRTDAPCQPASDVETGEIRFAKNRGSWYY